MLSSLPLLPRVFGPGLRRVIGSQTTWQKLPHFVRPHQFERLCCVMFARQDSVEVIALGLEPSRAVLYFVAPQLTSAMRELEVERGLLSIRPVEVHLVVTCSLRSDEALGEEAEVRPDFKTTAGALAELPRCGVRSCAQDSMQGDSQAERVRPQRRLAAERPRNCSAPQVLSAFGSSTLARASARLSTAVLSPRYGPMNSAGFCEVQEGRSHSKRCHPHHRPRRRAAMKVGGWSSFLSTAFRGRWSSIRGIAQTRPYSPRRRSTIGLARHSESVGRAAKR
jgi:hypothetical protein